MVKHPLSPPRLPEGARLFRNKCQLFRWRASKTSTPTTLVSLVCISGAIATLLIFSKIIPNTNASVLSRSSDDLVVSHSSHHHHQQHHENDSESSNPSPPSSAKFTTNLPYYTYHHDANNGTITNGGENFTNIVILGGGGDRNDESGSSSSSDPELARSGQKISQQGARDDKDNNYSLLNVPSRTFPATIHGLRVEEASKVVSYDGSASVIVADSDAVIRLFGDGFTPNTIIKFVTDIRPRGSDCDSLASTKPFALDKRKITQHSVLATIRLPPPPSSQQEFYLCTKENGSVTSWTHQGAEKWIIMKSYEKWIPLWAQILMLITLLLLSGLFSGLNLGLMAMDITELKIIEKTGTETEKRHAKTVKPLRHAGNYLLCSILLGNVMFNSTLTILLDDITTGLIAVITSTIGIVIFGEIIPQAVCSRHGLAVGAHTVWITKFTMAITFPLSYPVSFILDKILGEEIGNVYNRERLRELIRITEHGLKSDEVNVIEGVLKLANATCADVMTKLASVFMLPLSGVLDFFTVDDIIKSGYSRIPIYDGERSNVVSILYTKDLAFIDPDDRMPLKSLCEFYQYKCNFVDDTKKLDAMFREFKEGDKGHMAFVRQMHISDNSDPFYEVVGVLTLEDVIEELIQAEISDETDVRDGHINRIPSRATLNEMSLCNDGGTTKGGENEGGGGGGCNNLAPNGDGNGAKD